MSKVAKVVKAVTSFFQDTLGRTCTVVAAGQNEQGQWLVKAETPEEVEYMRQRARDDLLGLYHVTLDDALNVLAYERVAIRERNRPDYGSEISR